MKVKVSVTQLCLTLSDTRHCSLPGSSVHELLQIRILECVASPFSRGNLHDPGIRPGSPALHADSLPSEPQGSLFINIAVVRKCFNMTYILKLCLIFWLKSWETPVGKAEWKPDWDNLEKRIKGVPFKHSLTLAQAAGMLWMNPCTCGVSLFHAIYQALGEDPAAKRLRNLVKMD